MLRKLFALSIILVIAADSVAQTTSLAHRRKSASRAETNSDDPRNLKPQRGNPTLERHSLTAVKEAPPRTYKLHDLVTIIVREQRKYEADGALESKKQFDVKSQINALFKPINGTLGAATFLNGKPEVDFKFKDRLKHEADKDREDRFTTRITGEVIDVKPNGNLILQAKADVRFDNEHSIVTLTGTVRADDVTPDNTVLSTQLSDKVVDVQNSGAIRDGSRRGWVPRLLDFLRPF